MLPDVDTFEAEDLDLDTAETDDLAADVDDGIVESDPEDLEDDFGDVGLDGGPDAEGPGLCRLLSAG